MILRKTMLAVMAASFIFVGCASNKDPEPKELEGQVKTEVLEHKGAALGVNQLPVWVETYIAEGILGVEKLSSYAGSYCFIGEEAGSNLDALQTWVTSFDVPGEIARNVSTRVDVREKALQPDSDTRFLSGDPVQRKMQSSLKLQKRSSTLQHLKQLTI